MGQVRHVWQAFERLERFEARSMWGVKCMKLVRGILACHVEQEVLPTRAFMRPFGEIIHFLVDCDPKILECSGDIHKRPKMVQRHKGVIWLAAT